MASLAQYLYPVAARRTTPAIIGWWEQRRLMFNIVVGVAGLFTLGIFALISVLPPSLPMNIPWQAPVVYAILANVCYTFGWMIEATLNKLWGPDVYPIGPVLFRQGLAFAVGLTLLPNLLAVGSWVVRAFIRVF